MKVLSVNKFPFIEGSVGTVYPQEHDMLKQAGVQVIDFPMQHENNFSPDYMDYFASNADYHKASDLLGDIRTAANFIRNSQACRKILVPLERERPDIVHFHNIYHQLTPALIKIARNFGCKMMLTAHDCKIVCLAYSMLRDGKVCDSCTTGTVFDAFRYHCQEDSVSKSPLLSLEVTWQYIAQNYQALDVIVSPNVFLRGVLLCMLSSSCIDVIVNGVDDSRPLAEVSDGGYMLYSGRLSREKGVVTLLAVYKKMQDKAPLEVVGYDPLHGELTAKYPDVEFSGYMQQGETLDKLIKHARAVILSLGHYENCSMTILEAISLGKPVIGLCIGDIPKQIRDGIEGILFESGNVHELANAMDALADPPEKARNMGSHGCTRLSEKYALNEHMDTLQALYKELLSRP